MVFACAVEVVNNKMSIGLSNLCSMVEIESQIWPFTAHSGSGFVPGCSKLAKRVAVKSKFPFNLALLTGDITWSHV